MVFRKEIKGKFTIIDCQVTLRSLPLRMSSGKSGLYSELTYFNDVIGKYLFEFFSSYNLSAISLGVKKISIGLIFCGNHRIQRINFENRNLNKKTDVLSFPLYDSLRKKLNAKQFLREPFLHLGDIVISIPVAQAQAKTHKISLSLEMSHLFMHGFLHLMGFDHEINENEAKLMFAIEEKLVKQVSTQKNK